MFFWMATSAVTNIRKADLKRTPKTSDVRAERRSPPIAAEEELTRKWLWAADLELKTAETHTALPEAELDLHSWPISRLLAVRNGIVPGLLTSGFSNFCSVDLRFRSPKLSVSSRTRDPATNSATS